ncbi:MAG: hypothetical protein K5656_02540 [Lachnospiraceae bacterium]|nr:hypothetical protein [Lachnospiraceae bacterium]
MVIQSSTVSMASSRSYRENYSELAAESNFGQMFGATLPEARDSGFDSLYGSANDEPDLLASYDANGKYTFDNSLSDDVNQPKDAKLTTDSSNQDVSRLGDILDSTAIVSDEDEFNSYINSETTKTVMKKVLNSKTVYMVSLRELLQQMISRRRDFLEKVLNLQFERRSSYYTITTKTYEYEYSESESTSFSTTGNVKTADGREINFDLGINMTRSFSETYSYEKTTMTEAFLKDPLVINTKGGPASLEDKTFTFDIDSDGELDNISILSEYCGYLALDKNEDGIINDGSELFGAKTGNGFLELAVFDMDNNGWIDENDEVFDKLKIWSKDADGVDHLVGIGVAGIGAICLANAKTNFSIKNDENETLGVIRSTGIALNEDGTTATIQQLDLAVS